MIRLSQSDLNHTTNHKGKPELVIKIPVWR
jgi:hypothetical protein